MTEAAGSSMLMVLARLGSWAIYSGLQHLPPKVCIDDAPYAPAFEALVLLDRLIGMDAPVKAIEDQTKVVEGALGPITAAGYDPIALYARATIARIRTDASSPVRRVRSGTATPLPIAPTAMIDEQARDAMAERVKRYLLGFALHLFDSALFNAGSTKPGLIKELSTARDAFHQAIKFFASNYDPHEEDRVLAHLQVILSNLARAGWGSDELEGLIQVLGTPGVTRPRGGR